MTQFNARIRARDFSHFIDGAGSLIEDARLNITKDNINIKAVDDANVCMVDATLDNKAFLEYETDEEDPFTLGINIKNMDFLKLLKPEDYITIRYNKEDEDGRINYKSGRFEYSLSLLNVDTIRKAPKKPDIEYGQEISILGQNIKTVIKANQKIKDTSTLTFEVKDNNFVLSGKGMQSNMNYIIPENELENHTEDMNVPISCMFDMDYLVDIIKGIGNSDVVKLKIKTNYPIMISQMFADGNGSIMYLLAPRMDDDY